MNQQDYLKMYQTQSPVIQNEEEIDYILRTQKTKLSQYAIETMSIDFDLQCTPKGVEFSPTQDNESDKQNEFIHVPLKHIKSKQEIQIESKENETILLNLNSNIDDLFKKISSLTDQITTEFSEPLCLKEKQITPFNQQSNIPIIHRSKINNKLFEVSQLSNSKQSSNKCQSQFQYKPIFFQSSLNVSNKAQSVNMKLFEVGKSLGYGKFGEVVSCKNRKTNAIYALKKIFKSLIEEYVMENQLLIELKILSQINHPNIIKAYDSFTDDFHIFILMEYVQGIPLTKKYKSSELQIKHIIRQTAQALKYLHSLNITHRDLKPENIILTADNVVKICDFGWSSEGKNQMNILCGTLDYVTYEMTNEIQYTQKTDFWNLGVLTYELIYGYPPFRGSSKSKIFEKVKSLDYEFSDQIEISAQCKNFIENLLKPEKQRLTIQQILAHEFLLVQEEQSQDGKIHQIEEEFQGLFSLVNSQDLII